jgi:hypothetical protein
MIVLYLQLVATVDSSVETSEERGVRPYGIWRRTLGNYLPTLQRNIISSSVTSDFRRDVEEICAILRYNAPSSVNPFTNVSGQRIAPIFKRQDFLTLEYGADMLSRNVGI